MGNSPFCCLCNALCIPDESYATKAKKNRLKWKEFKYDATNHPLPPIFVLLIDLYDGKDVYEELELCRVNPDYTSNRVLRNDLEFYIPQLTNFMAFHGDFARDKLFIFLEQWSKVDPYFAHLSYWYIRSLLPDINQGRAQEIMDAIIEENSLEEKIQLFSVDYEKFFLGLSQKLGPVEYETKLQNINARRLKAKEIIEAYKNTNLWSMLDAIEIKASDLELKLYKSPFIQTEEFISNPFTSTLLFFDDLCFAAEDVIKMTNRLEALKKLLYMINKSLSPSYVYVPFVKESICHYAVLNIVVEETRVFSTKERAPFYICLELFRPQEELAYEYKGLFGIKEEVSRKKEGKLLRWAKKTFHVGDKTKVKSEQHIGSSNNPSSEITDEQFKTTNVDEIISQPITLKQPRPFPLQPSPITDLIRRASQSLILTSSVNDNDYHLLQNEESKAQEGPPKYLVLPSEGRAKRYISEDIRDVRLHLKDKNYSFDGKLSPEDRSRKSSFASRKISYRKSPLIEPCQTKLGSEITNLEPLVEEEKVTEPSKEFEKPPLDPKKEPLAVANDEPLDSSYFFGENSRVQAERIRSKSPFGNLKTWKLVHLIMKSGADMKEEQFAIQLISKFEHIFKLENLKLMLSSYEILSLGEKSGVVEVVKDAATFSGLKEKMYLQGISTLNEFFEKFYGKDVHKARKQFCRSLAAYSLVCYFLQIKDRHNGNIMLHKDGHIVHIDFGFFLSNSPGKGIEFERKIPFKLLNEYVEVLGGHRSKLFQKFRILFYKGFLAARKHREQILILVKMMYSSQSQSFPCFKGGIKVITDLERRFLPPGVSERDLSEYCYNLINQSLDNWRAKCYDKYQYYFQGILY